MEPDLKAIRAQGQCGCGCATFHVFLFSCGADHPRCTACGAFWSSPVGGKADYAGGDEAVGEARDEPQNVVQKASGDWNAVQTPRFKLLKERLELKKQKY